MSRILLVEDEARIAAFVEKGLRANGFATTTVAEGEAALALASTGEFDLVVLDLGLPDMDGLDVLRELRKHDRTLPVVILTARDSVSDTVTGLEGGADDYVTKPFRFEELLARIRVRLRDEHAPEETVLSVGSASLDLRTRRATVGDLVVELSAREFALAEVLFRHPGQVLSRQQLLSHVWGYDFEPGSNVVDVYVGYLRRKLGKGLVTSVRGMGYRLEQAPTGDEDG
jgi:DNA-binding response OmpR family regulator